MDEWVLVVATLAVWGLLLWVETSFDVFLLRKLWRVLRERQPPEWDDPALWRESKRAARWWTVGVLAYFAAVFSIAVLPERAGMAVGALLLAAPVVFLAWWGLIGRR